MSERGSFCTEYLYCDNCANALKVVFDKENLHEGNKYFKPEYLYCVADNGSESHEKFRIIAGKVGGLYGGEEHSIFDWTLRESIEQAICCPVDIAVLSDDSDYRRIVHFTPKKKEDSTNGN